MKRVSLFAGPTQLVSWPIINHVSRESPGTVKWSLLAAVVYLAISSLLFWHLLLSGTRHALICPCSDSYQMSWFFEWTTYALSHGKNPLHSSLMFAPSGINLADNPSLLFPTLLLSPVTLGLGALTSFNLASILAPAASAFALFAAMRRFAVNPFARLIAGLLYGFSPFVLGELFLGDLQLAILVAPPMFLLVLDDILIRQRMSPTKAGLGLAGLTIAQFFTSQEVLFDSALLALLGVAVIFAAKRKDLLHQERCRWKHIVKATSIALATASATLAYPIWYMVAGPRAIPGPLWKHTENWVTSLSSLVDPTIKLTPLSHATFTDVTYLGLPLLLFIVVVAWKWRRDSTTVFAAAMLLTSLVLSMGDRLHFGARATDLYLPWRLFAYLPLADKAIPYRFAIFSSLFAAMIVAIGLDKWMSHSPMPTAYPSSSSRSEDSRSWLERHKRHKNRLATMLFIGTVIPWLPAFPTKASFPADLTMPYTAHRIDPPPVPALTTTTSDGLLPLVALYPTPTWSFATPLLWQAESGFSYRILGGYGFIPSRARYPDIGPHKTAISTLFHIYETGNRKLPSANSPLSRRALIELNQLRVGEVVVVDRGKYPESLVRLLEVMLHRTPKQYKRSWVWRLSSSEQRS
ncbi:MAG: hypothetical protein M1131_06045 [Actinobacteria bacterium]|nr:hypothetical protein [Actinomycetota bacterium]MCL6094736.1 hypothetical protein [Actinomycetota bacterium]